MGKVYERLDEHQREWIGRRELFFVGTAPLAGDGRVNVLPKGPIGTFRVLGDHSVAYLDMVGSGAETVAHLRENGRIVVMFCAFDGPPRILRLHGRGEVVPADDPRFGELCARAAFEPPHDVEAARRAVILVEVERIADSCGYGVPLMSYEGERVHAEKWAEKKLRAGGESAIVDYMEKKNAVSIDGLPAFDAWASASAEAPFEDPQIGGNGRAWPVPDHCYPPGVGDPPARPVVSRRGKRAP